MSSFSNNYSDQCSDGDCAGHVPVRVHVYEGVYVKLLRFQYRAEKYDFFPVNKALSLSHFYEDRQEVDRIEALSATVDTILQRITQQVGQLVS